MVVRVVLPLGVSSSQWALLLLLGRRLLYCGPPRLASRCHLVARRRTVRRVEVFMRRQRGTRTTPNPTSSSRPSVPRTRMRRRYPKNFTSPTCKQFLMRRCSIDCFCYLCVCAWWECCTTAGRPCTNTQAADFNAPLDMGCVVHRIVFGRHPWNRKTVTLKSKQSKISQDVTADEDEDIYLPKRMGVCAWIVCLFVYGCLNTRE